MNTIKHTKKQSRIKTLKKKNIKPHHIKSLIQKQHMQKNLHKT